MNTARDPGRQTVRLLLGLLAGIAANGAALANPCDGKTWVNAPLLALRTPGSGEGSQGGEGGGIGGTGHSGDGIGMGGSGHSGDGQGMGGTGRSGDEQGLGGTGHGGAGIGGTGAVAARDPGDEGMGGTGIVGVVAGFGSICVNGVEVHYPASVPVHLDGRSARASDLALGQAVSVRAEWHDGGYHATEIHGDSEVLGPVSSVDIAGGVLRILGQDVKVTPAVAAAVRAGDRLAVSGGRGGDGAILPTRIARAGPAGFVSVSALVTAVSAGEVRLGGLAIRLSAGVTPPHPGDEVLVRGRLEDGVLLAESVERNARTRFSGPLRHLSLQGYLRHVSSREVDVDGVAVRLPSGMSTSLPAGLMAGSRVLLSAGVSPDGRALLEGISVMRPKVYESRPAAPGGASGDSSGGKNSGGDSGASGSVSATSTSRVSSTQEEGAAIVPSVSLPEVDSAPAAQAIQSSESVLSSGSAQSVAAGPALSSTASDGEISEKSAIRGAERSRSESARPEAARAEASRSALARTEGVKPEIPKAEVYRPEVARPEVARPEVARPEIARPEIARPEIARPEIARPEMARPEVVRVEMVRPERPERGR